MAETKIPDAVLESLRCRCGRYLSASSIYTGQDGISECNTCFNIQSSPWSTQNLAYETIAQLFKFPCTYKDKGCFKYMKFNEINKHEKKCRYRTYECPENLLTPCNVVNSTKQLCKHYREDHPYLCLEEPSFEINITTDSEKYLLIKIDHHVYVLRYKCCLRQGKLWFFVNHFRTADDSMYIHYQVRLTDNDDSERSIDLECKNAEPFRSVPLNQSQAVEIDVAALMSMFRNNGHLRSHWNITMRDELKQKIKKEKDLEEQEIFEENKESLKCPHCRIYMVPPIYRCHNNHLSCEDCLGYNEDCKSCQSHERQWTVANDLGMFITKRSQFSCRWLKCNELLNYSQIREHERECIHKRYKCPVCDWFGIKDEIVNHFKILHPEIKVHLGNSMKFSANSDSFSYIIAHEDIFLLIVKILENKKEFRIEVHYLGLPTFVGNWTFQIKTDSDCGSGTVYLQKKYHNRYAKKVYKAQKPQSYKIGYLSNYCLTIEKKGL